MWFMFCSAAFLLSCWGGVHQFLCPMDTHLAALGPCPTTATDPGGELPATALAERVGDFNQSMDP